MKLGKKEPINKLSVSFGDFITVYPTSPIIDYAPDFVYPMDMNDTIGDCVVAGFDHSRQIITGLLTGTQKNFTNDDIINFYKTQNPAYPQEDNGMSIQLFLEYLVNNKYILGFAKIDYKNPAQMKAAMYLGLSIMTGVQLQEAQHTQFASGIWDYDINSPVIGGHCINGAGYNVGIVDFVSWGKLIAGTDSFVAEQMDEAWFILMQEHVDHPSFRNHFDLAGFSQAIKTITNGKVIIPVPPAPTYPTLRLGSKGDAVKLLQTLLNKFGYTLIVDGNFGPKTGVAVKDFQTKHNLVADQVVGPKTWQALTGIIPVNPKQAIIDVITKVCTDNGIEPLLGVSVATCESGLDPNSTLYNPASKSTDRGLFQWNSVYHSEITDAQAFDPMIATKLFCDAVKAGKLHEYWSASQFCWSVKLTPDIRAKYGV